MLKKNIGPIIGILCLIAVVCVAAWQYSDAHAYYVEAQTAQVESGKGGSGSSTEIDKSLRTKMKELTGYDDARVKLDDKSAESFFRTIMTWDTYEEYNENRKLVMEKGVEEDSNFLTMFFPEIKIVTDEDGNEYNDIDNGDGKLNMAFGSLSSRVINIDGDVYSYFAEMTVTSGASYKTTSGDKQSIAGTGKCVVTYDIDADGNISNIEGYTLSVAE